MIYPITKAPPNHTPAADTNQYAASNAVDGDIATCMRTNAIGKVSPDKTVWWKVDFGGVFNIYKINILFKEYKYFGKCKYHPAQNMHDSYNYVV